MRLSPEVRHELWVLFYRNSSVSREEYLKSRLINYSLEELEEALENFINWCNHTPRGWQAYHKRLRRILKEMRNKPPKGL